MPTPKPITIYGIKNCDTMKKARAWLDGHGVAYAFHDYKAAGIDRGRRSQAGRSEVGWETLLNRAGTTFRKLPDADKDGLDRAQGDRADAGPAFDDQAAGARSSAASCWSASSRRPMRRHSASNDRAQRTDRYCAVLAREPRAASCELRASRVACGALVATLPAPAARFSANELRLGRNATG